MDDSRQVIEALEQACSRFSRSEVARRLGRDPKTISRWKNGQTSTPPYLMPALRDLLGPSVACEGQFTFIDLFAGIGGIRLGFQEAGGQCVFTSEWNQFSARTYAENFPGEHEIAGDITAVDAHSVPDHDVLLAGFPCQPFSIAGVSKKNALGRPHGFECTTQGTLFFDIARIISAKRPKAFVLENVKNLRSHDGGRTYNTIMDVLKYDLNYPLVQARIIDGKSFVPQHRERIIIVGFREDVGIDLARLELPDVAAGPRLRAILHREDGTEVDCDAGRYIDPKTGQVHARYTLTPNLWAYLKDYAEKHRAKGNGFGYGLVGPDDVARTLSARYYKDGSEILIRRKGGRPRRLTPRECARLMGFPDSFRIPVSDSQAYRQFGNSVVVPVVSAVAQLMRPFIVAMSGAGTRDNVQRRLFE